MKVIIRCDANIEIATGHMKRCLNIASELKHKGTDVIFAVASDSSVDYVKDTYRVIKFDNEYNEPAIEESKMIKALKDEKPDILLIDSYFVTKEYMAKMQEYTKTAYIDDLYECVWPADIIINYGIIADSYPYEKDYENSVRILGPKYMPINPAYKNVKPCRINETARKVLVVSGGSDENHVMLNLLKTVNKLKLEFTFICGAFNQDYEEMESLAEDNIRVLKSLPNLSEAISESDIIVTAGGTTLYEMAILGCPGIIYKIADNQNENVKGFVKKEIALYAGDVRENFSYEKMSELIDSLSKDYEKRKELSDTGRAIVDANGAERLADKLIEASK